MAAARGGVVVALRSAVDYGIRFLTDPPRADPRVEGWPLMDSPWTTVGAVAAYLYVVLVLGPRLMVNQKPFNLRTALIAYNAAQVLFSIFMFWEHLMSGWLLDYSFRCQPVDYSMRPQAMRMVNLCWWYYISKLTEFADTLFFVLRKKDSQITPLHLYHHSLTPIETWICVKYLAGGHGTFSNLINNVVHIIMYSYYLMAALGPEYSKYLWWKKYLTTIQMAQFVLVFYHSAQVLFINCGYPRIVAAFLLLHSSIFFVLFLDFYRGAYGVSWLNKKFLQLPGFKKDVKEMDKAVIEKKGHSKKQ
ncbi:elongation of very long chain fatty acids protein AAEL008004-like [Ischnura elegans]|uniref:elongation of very long chain fatty acids protein AAEL008004-like n=1 Tax=Ischnura elegans TaxID=197161 RepID=UPI001ED89D05|nr:elongation of very long chain fatty acids protein AAEL008004-like [Ischnura elegans]XP_046400922.1 elongation of very long chain fatty acids protein AAEL008004-like [Ischnura elegans]